MEIRYKLYPHPVLWEYNDDYRTSVFKTDITAVHTARNISIHVEFNTDNRELTEYIKNGMAEFLVHIECPLTSFRRVYSTDKPSIDISLPNDLLNSRLSVCTFIVAKCHIEDLSPSDLNDDYSGISFSVDKGAILAIGKQVVVNIEKDMDDLADLPSIFIICKTESYDCSAAEFQLDSDKIRIVVNGTDYGRYRLLSARPDIDPVIHSAIVFPALIYTLEQLKQGFSEYEDWRWFKALSAAFRRCGLPFDEEYVREQPSYLLAQKLLELPVSRALKSLCESGMSEEDDQ